MAYNIIEPFGEWRADVRNAHLASVIANVNRSSKSRPLTINDFMLKFGEQAESQKQSAEEMMAVLEVMTKESGGKITRKDEVT